MSLTAKQQELLDAPEPEILFTGSRGAGMTFGSARWLEQGKECLWVVDHIHDSANAFGVPYKVGATSTSVVGPSNHIWISSLHFELKWFRGFQFDRIAFDVTADYLPFQTYTMMIDRYPRARFLVATGPPDKGMNHWMGGYFFRHPNRRVIHTSLTENVALDKKYLDMLAPIHAANPRIAGEWK